LSFLPVQCAQKFTRVSVLGRDYQKRLLNLQELYDSSLAKNQELEQELLTSVEARTVLEKRAESAEERIAYLEAELKKAESVAERNVFLEGELRTRDEVINIQGRQLKEKIEKLKELEPVMDRLWRKEQAHNELREKYMEATVRKFRAWKAEAAKKMDIQFGIGEVFSFFFLEDIVSGMYPDAGIDWAAVQRAYNERTGPQNQSEVDAKMAEALTAAGEEDPMEFYKKDDGFGRVTLPSTGPSGTVPEALRLEGNSETSAVGRGAHEAVGDRGTVAPPSPPSDPLQGTLPPNVGSADA
jgi:hypothetical protein